VRRPEGGRGTALRLLGAPVVDDVGAASGGSVRERNLRVPADDEGVGVRRPRPSARTPRNRVGATRGARLTETTPLSNARLQCSLALAACRRKMAREEFRRGAIASALLPGVVIGAPTSVSAYVANSTLRILRIEAQIAVGANDDHAARFPRRGGALTVQVIAPFDAATTRANLASWPP
jgi:hypothetical protein